MLKVAICGSLLLAASPVGAADPDYCRPYAAQLSQRLITYVWNRAYTTCLNEDEPPALPLTNEEGWKIIFDKFVQAQPIETKGLADKPATEKPVVVVNGDAAWRARCASNFRSWDPKTQTVIPYHGKRQRCPCPDHCDKP